MKKLLLLLLLVPMVSCSSDDDSGDELITCNCTATATINGELQSTTSGSVDSVPIDECLSGNSDISSTSGDITVRVETVCTVS